MAKRRVLKPKILTEKFTLDPAHAAIDLFAQQITMDVWRDKYSLPSENHPHTSMARVCEGIYRNDPAVRAREEALEAMMKGLWVPGGRIHAGAGTQRVVTLHNCYVLRTMEDSMHGIAHTLSDAMLTMQQGGGIGTDFSTLRPSGAYLSRTDAVASGPLPFMNTWDAMCSTIMSAGSRRGAMMGTIRDDHPDLPKFIEAKHTQGKLTNFNVSVLISDAFMDAVAQDEEWLLGFGIPRADGKHVGVVDRDEGSWYIYEKIRARKLWDMIIRSTYEYSEPGVIFIDRVNEQNNLKYCETISCTNPCVTGDTLVSTPRGLIPAKDIKEGDEVTCVRTIETNKLGGYKSGPETERVTGKIKCVEKHKDATVYKVTLKSGQTLRVTAGHIFHTYKRIRNKATRMNPQVWTWEADKRLDELKPGDVVRLAPGITPNNILTSPYLGTQYQYGLLMGIILGDGSYTEDSEYLKIAVGSHEQEWIEVIKQLLRSMGENAILQLHENKSRGNSATLQLSAEFKRVTEQTPLCKAKSPDKHIPLEFLNSNYDFLWGLFDGLISTDGAINKHQLGGIIKLTTSSPHLARDFQRLCHLLGMNARIYLSKRKGKTTTIVGNTFVNKRDMYEVILQGEHFHKVNNTITLSHPRKAIALKEHAKTFNPQHDRWQTEIVSIEPDGVEDVYDLYEEHTDTWITEGIVSRGCGEQPLPPNGACNLGAVNLARMVKDPFGQNPTFDFTLLRKIVRVGMRFLDNVIDVSGYPLEEQHQEQINKRRTGLGITGLGNALAEMKIRYGTEESLHFTETVMQEICEAAYDASADLAVERGAFPLYDKHEWGQTSVVKNLPTKIRQKIDQNGIRNGMLLTIAPTGTTSLYMGNVSSGLEPVFLHEVLRKVRQPDGEFNEYIAYDYGYNLFQHIYGQRFGDHHNLPDYLVTHEDLTVKDHVRMQAVCQQYIDASVSKTINCPEDIDFEDFKLVYWDAYSLGCKGCTTYRPSEVRGSVLSSGKKKEAPQRQRPDKLEGTTYKVKWPSTEGNYYITINHDAEGKPFEMFISSNTTMYSEWTNALSLLISAIMRLGVTVNFVPEELKKVTSFHDTAWIGGKHYGSLVALIGDILGKHLNPEEPINESNELQVEPHRRGPSSLKSTATHEICPKCTQPSLIRQEGCKVCTNCGFSTCG